MHRRTLLALLHLVAVYLCAIVALQGVAAAQAIGAGPAHRHAADGFAQPHAHHHATGERHQHTAVDGTGAVPADDGFDHGAEALLLALGAAAACGTTQASRCRLRHVQRAAAAWACCTGFVRAALRPPRPA